MGDRGNIHVREDANDTGVWLYTHWTGSSLEETLRKALVRGRDRWDDCPYLTRIIFCEMLKDDGGGDSLDQTTGYGISARLGDGGTDLEVNVETQVVSLPGGKTLSFEEFTGANCS